MKKHWQYLKYVIRHKWFVWLAGQRTGAPGWRLLIHDWTKFLPVEWGPYTEFFYGKKPPKGRCSLCGATRIEESNGRYGVCTLIGCKEPDFDVRREREIKQRFDRAWLHHQKWNKHHWQYWVMPEDTPSNPSGNPKVLEMPEKYVREMIADWMGAGRAITGKWGINEWYSKNKNNIKLHPKTRLQVEWLINHGISLGIADKMSEYNLQKF